MPTVFVFIALLPFSLVERRPAPAAHRTPARGQPLAARRALPVHHPEGEGAPERPPPPPASTTSRAAGAEPRPPRGPRGRGRTPAPRAPGAPAGPQGLAKGAPALVGPLVRDVRLGHSSSRRVHSRLPPVPRVEVTRTHVELPERAALRPAPRPDPRARVERVEGCPASFFRYLYAEVGRGYFWLERIRWTGRADPRPPRRPRRVALPPDGRRRSRRLLRAGEAPRRLGRGLLLRPPAGVPGPRPRQVPAHRGGGGRVGARRLARLAPHLHPRPPGRARQLPRPRLPARSGPRPTRRTCRSSGARSSARVVRRATDASIGPDPIQVQASPRGEEE